MQIKRDCIFWEEKVNHCFNQVCFFIIIRNFSLKLKFQKENPFTQIEILLMETLSSCALTWTFPFQLNESDVFQYSSPFDLTDERRQCFVFHVFTHNQYFGTNDKATCSNSVANWQIYSQNLNNKTESNWFFCGISKNRIYSLNRKHVTEN